MASYHLSPNGPRMCKAIKGQCPYGARGEEHYGDALTAQKAFEKKMSETFPNMPLKRSVVERERMHVYQDVDTMHHFAKKITNGVRVARNIAAVRISSEAKIARYNAIKAGEAVSIGVKKADGVLRSTFGSKARAMRAERAEREIRERQLHRDRRNSTIAKKMLQFLARGSQRFNERVEAILEAKYSRKPKLVSYGLLNDGILGSMTPNKIVNHI